MTGPELLGVGAALFIAAFVALAIMAAIRSRR